MLPAPIHRPLYHQLRGCMILLHMGVYVCIPVPFNVPYTMYYARMCVWSHLCSVQFDGKKVVSGAYDFLVKVWDPRTLSCLHTLQGHSNRVYSLQVRLVYLFTYVHMHMYKCRVYTHTYIFYYICTYVVYTCLCT